MENCENKIGPNSKMKNYKSFRIDDILVDASKSESNSMNEKYKSETPCSVNETISEELPRSKTLAGNWEWAITRLDTDRIKWKLEKEYSCHSSSRDTSSVGDLEVTKVHSDYPPRFSPFPLSQVPAESGGKLQSYSSILPYYSVDEALRFNQSRSLLKHYATASHIFSFPTFSPFQKGHFESGSSDYAIPYPGLSGQYGILLPNFKGTRDGLMDKRPYASEKGHYSMYTLSRPMYASSCKRKGGQIRFNNSQTGQLEKAFVHQKYLNATERKKLAQDLGLTEKHIKTWFQNRRAKLRKSKGIQFSDSELPGSPEDHHIDTSSQYVDSP